MTVCLLTTSYLDAAASNAGRVTSRSGDDCEGSVLIQHISVLLHHFNSVLLHGHSISSFFMTFLVVSIRHDLVILNAVHRDGEKEKEEIISF